MKKPTVSIVIVNYNGKELLKKALDSVYKSGFKDYELIVADNDSDDKSPEFIRKNYPKAIIVQNPTNEGYVGINSALKFCRGDYILFLNNDLEIEKNCIKELLSAIKKDDKIAMAAPMLVNLHDKSLRSGGTWVSRAFYSGHIKGSGNEIIKEIPYMGIGLINKVVIDMFGYLFDKEYFIYAEDLDLGLRLRLLGLKTVFVPSAEVYHLHAATMAKTKDYKKTFLLERNLLMTFFKILSLRSILIYLPYALLIRLIAVLKDFATLKFMSALARISALFWIISHAKEISKKRKGLQLARKMGDEFVLEVFSEKYLFRKWFAV